MSYSHPTAWLLGVGLSAAIAWGSPVSGQQRLAVARPALELPLAVALDRYARGDATAPVLTAESLPEHLRQLRRAATEWVGSKESPDAARRRLAVATYVLDVIDGNFDIAWQPGLGTIVLEWACALLREVPSMAAEKSWYAASIALLERAHRMHPGGPIYRQFSPVAGEDLLVVHVGHAEARFPGDGRWTVARAVATELLVWPPPRDEETLRIPRNVEPRILARLQAAVDQPTVRAEAHLRWGYLELRSGQTEAALVHFDAAGTPEDRVLRYWLHLFRGRALTRMNRPSEAVESYRHALAEFPYAQSATLALGAVLVADQQTTQAADLVTRMLTLEPPLDPWRLYGFPAYREWSALVGELRQAIKR